MASNELHFEPYTKFTIEGDHSIMRGLATVGKFTTGEDCPTSLALGTSDGKVERNSDFFYREMPDGVSALSVADGLPGSSPTEGGGSVLFAGGDCNIRGFDRGGGEVFWTITGDRVMALDSLKPAEDSPQQLPTSVLICGEAEVVADITEADAVCHLVSLDHRHRFGYGLVNGTVGVYEGSKRVIFKTRTGPDPLAAVLSMDYIGSPVPVLMAIDIEVSS
ncbi:conserved hypothetical protein [Perkinsus marinus ATCC 50983]|uniref:Ciliary BBSome complex subunit 2 middle region domain-containing protein n=1 Tax=Perkinsus marinus (strain ATCC 50983 / TXsc) TaxID=423536 RepID=C5KS16_PERM5|nr:conserved hypothetical protein [Perkinsus marinus ATCC 50983]EER12707.1 conserved hypothetical protein [Perkinsus marinus ATCC 50983]|eukprot:XP_002780912.1 conserved hypothetical protein [Perkinsus marinus ATCC 50983]